MLEWNSLIMLQIVQAKTYTAKCRAGTFFAGVGLLSVTVFVNYTEIAYPRAVRGNARAEVCLPATRCHHLQRPWRAHESRRFLTQASTFITVLSSFSVFTSPAAAILIVDFWIIRHQKCNTPNFTCQAVLVRGGYEWAGYDRLYHRYVTGAVRVYQCRLRLGHRG